jgi:hypothetical protein
MRTTGYPQTDHAARVRGFAAILHEDEYLDLIARHEALNQGDYSTYLAGLHSRMTAAKQAQKQVLIGPFLTDQYESYAEAIGEPATSKHALRAYDDFVARVGPYTRTWTGEPITHVISDLREATDTTADQAKLLPLLKQSADQHPDPQRAAADALSTAAELVAPLLKHTEPGHHTLTCIVQLPRQTVRYALPVVRAGDIVAFPDGGPEQLLCAALATAHLADQPATLLLRSHPLTVHAKTSHPTRSSTPAQPVTSRSHTTHPDPASIRAWRLTAGRAIPLTAAQAFALAHTNPTVSQSAPPEPGAQYIDAFPLASDPL